MNQSMDAPGLLRAAATLIDRALAQLDTNRQLCRHCDTSKPMNKQHSRVHENLSQVPDRLRRGARILNGEEE